MLFRSAPKEGDPDVGFAGAPVMGARFGSAGIMPLAWIYLALLDDADLREASLSAIASANYLSRRLADSFPTLVLQIPPFQNLHITA